MTTALWHPGDTLKRDRLNRGAILGRLGVPMYDVDNTGTVTVAPVSIDGVALGAAAASVYAVPGAGVAVSILESITLCNTDATARAVSVYIVESGAGAVSVARQIFADTLQPGEQVLMGAPWFMGPGDSLWAGAAVGAVVSLRAEALEFAAQPDGLTLTVVNGAALGNALATYYTVPGAGVTQALLLAATLCNTDAAARTPNLHVIPNAGAAAVANRVWSDALSAKETGIIPPMTVLKPGDFIQAKADAAAVASLRLTVLEAA